jgi:hypothetical protein
MTVWINRSLRRSGFGRRLVAGPAAPRLGREADSGRHARPNHGPLLSYYLKGRNWGEIHGNVSLSRSRSTGPDGREDKA